MGGDRARVPFDPPDEGPRGFYRHYVLLLCCLSFFLAYLDRNIFAALLTPIKQEFGLSDAALGLLSGLAFALTYSLLGVPMGALADRRSRKALLTVCIAVWSVMTGVCGVAKSALWLMAARLGVGAAEAGVTPTSISVIADLYPPSQRTRAISFYPIAGTLGAAAAFPIGTYLAAEYGWRSAFLVLTVPGLLLAALCWLTFREPRRGGSDQTIVRDEVPRLGQTLRYIGANRQLLLVFLAAGMSSTISAIAQWLPAFYQRSFGLGLIEVGRTLGLVLFVTGPIGMFAGAWFADRLGAGKVRTVTYILALLALVQAASGALMLATGDKDLSILGLVLWSTAMVTFVPPCFALSQSLVATRMRATSMGVLNVFNNIIGYGTGPVIVGAISGWLAPTLGGESLRWSLIAMSTGSGLAAALLFAAAARSPRHTAHFEGET